MKHIFGCAGLLILCGGCGANAAITCDELKSDYTKMLVAYRSSPPQTCSTSYVAQYNGYFAAMASAVCTCLANNQSATACNAVEQLCCDYTTSTATIGTTVVTYSGTWDSSTNTCKKKQSAYECTAGYYGTATAINTGCTQCPEATGIYTDSARTNKARGTSATAAKTQGECYLPIGTYYDSSGVFNITTIKCTY
ncbi:MAG: hypothetical protein K2L25_02120 [Alphaproteobacteria bacterium]|nr:hypothetical protein [Alphaproteobacteria bacterium]